jgi:hypothetical protein
MQARAFSDRTQAKKLGTTQRSSGVMPRAAANNGIEEMFVQNESVSLCLLLNRRTKTMRVIDFRAGPSHAKRLFVLKLAKREGIEKVYTLVERDETHTWMKLGFNKEANIPGFYKRSDAFLLGVGVDEALATEIKGSLEATSADDDDDDDVEVAPPKASPAHERMEKTLVQAKKQSKALLDRPLPVAKLAQVKASDVQKTVDKLVRSGAALTAFEPFGRDVQRRHFVVTAKNGFELVTSIESQACFANAFLELLTSPSSDHERLATVSSLRTICDKLLGEGVVSCFALAPSDDIALATAFVFNGFRRTGLLQGHMLVKGERKDAIVWSRKLADPKEV